MFVSYGISLGLCEIRIHLFGLSTFAKLPDNSINQSDARVHMPEQYILLTPCGINATIYVCMQHVNASNLVFWEFVTHFVNFLLTFKVHNVRIL